MGTESVVVSAAPDPASRQRVRWYTHDRFGMFIHFGLYSIPAGVWDGVTVGRNWAAEWIQTQGNWPHGVPAADYEALAHEFNPTKFDADAWIHELAGAGMRYLVITSKHHDGFALWPTKVDTFNIMDATPFGRDILGELKAACDAHGIKFGLYYSHWLDWKHPYGGRPHADEFYSEPRWEQPTPEQFEIYWQEKCLPQVTELIDRYDPVLFWFDTWADNSTPWINETRMDELIGLVRSKSPNCLINSRIGSWGHSKGHGVVDFLSTGDNQFPSKELERPWETSGTMQHSWGYHLRDYGWQSNIEILKHLIGNAARGGNYQLNVGPKGDGSFPLKAVRRLREVGGWMLVHESAIVGTSPNPYGRQSWGEITSRKIEHHKTRLYLHLFDFTPGAELIVEGPTDAAATAFVLETDQTVSVAAVEGGLALTIPKEVSKDNIPVIALDIVP